MVAPLSGVEARAFSGPQRFDAELLDCEVEGEIPSDMEGTFFRVGAEWYYPPKFPEDAFLHADGYISSFRFRDGKVGYKGRFVRTPRFEANLAAGRQQFGYYRNPFTNDEAVSGIDGTVSNTAPLIHAGRLFTLKEDAHPIEIDPHSLQTIGFWDLGDRYASETFTAHPKLDPLSGELIAFGYEATGLASDDLFVYFIDAAGEVQREVRLKVPYVSLIHDFAVTQEHLIFPFACYTTSMDRLRAGKIHWGWDRQLPSMIGIMRRDGDGSDIRWFKGPERCMMHTFNAYSEGNRVTLYAPFYDSNFFPFFPNVDGSAWDPAKAVSYIRKLTFDLDKSDDTWEEEILFPPPISDLGKVDPRYMTLPQRYAFTNFNDPSRPFDQTCAAGLRGPVTNSYGRFDLHTGELDRYFVGDTHTLQECSFVPRRGSTQEGDGYLIGTVSNLAERRTELVIVDAQHLAEGDLARVYLPFRADAQVHGIWCDAEQLAEPRAPGSAAS